MRHLILGFSSERDRKTVSKWFKAEKGTLLFHNTKKPREHLASETAKFRDQAMFYSTSPPTMILSVHAAQSIAIDSPAIHVFWIKCNGKETPSLVQLVVETFSGQMK